MAGKLGAVIALFLSGTQASMTKVGSGVVRIDLQKHFIPHVDIEDVEEAAETDEHIQIYVDEGNHNYAQLREQ